MSSSSCSRQQIGLFHTNRFAFQHVNKEKGQNDGLIVNISSIAGIDCSTPINSATKHSVYCIQLKFVSKLLRNEE